jgi:alpha-1,6-mannosyltransferase
MKIADVNEFYAERGGGVRTYVDAKLAAGAAMGHEVVVIAPGPTDAEERRGGGRVIWIRSRPMPVDPRYYLLLRQRAVHACLEREQPDVVEGSSPWTGGLFCARYAGPALKSFVFHQDPVAVYGHTLLGRALGDARVDALCGGYFAYLRALSARYDLTLTSGAWLAERLRRQGLRAPEAVPFGVDKRLFTPAVASAELRRELLARCALGADASLLITVCRHHPEKRLGTLIEAVARVQERRRVGLLLVGDGPLRSWVERRASRVPEVCVVGRVEDRSALAAMLASSDALLHGSAAETFGLSIAEALCAGVPLVVPDQGGAAALAAAEYAELYTAGDVAGCAAAIDRLLSRDPVQLRAAAVAAGRDRVEASDTHFERLFALYAARLSSPRTGRPAR